MTIKAYDSDGNQIPFAIYDDDYTVDDGEESIEEKMKKFNQNRLSLLAENNGIKMTLAPPQARDERETIEFLQRLTPKARTEMLTIMCNNYAGWYKDQQEELERVRG